ncbi:SGNH/GDSL hydrolase family protein [Streptomyces orinoci]|uniref:SGNH/GDSL hydrolase family protein n=1 Tax=Streptomyces orinoci TaxID=67339 RepID=A0ABV3K520_STRON|nr:SGNH/GDSL hydrolase family protein [Streptomyces orinoci]
MQLSRITGFLSAAALTLTVTLGVATNAQAAPASSGPAYVAMGDSYSSGVGSGSYDSASGSCKRSTRAYPALWAAAHAPSGFAFVACSGARTGDVLDQQIGSLGPDTRLVSLTIGGNDAGFGDTMKSCVLGSDSSCLDRIGQATAYIQDQLPGRLDDVYSAIGDKAPDARVVVLGYPRLYRLGGVCLGLSDTKRRALNDAADLLDSVIAKRAADHGFDYGDVAAAFAGHELCSGSPWLHSVSWPVDESYHPTAAGQSGGYLPVLTSAAG